MMRKITLATVVLTVTAFSVYFSWNGPVDEVQKELKPEITRAVSEPAMESVVRETEVANSRLLPTHNINLRKALAAAYSTNTNYREFIRTAKTQLDVGGGAYAMQAQMDCDYVKDALEGISNQPIKPERDSRIIVAKAEARTLLEARCGVLSKYEVGDLVYLDLKKQGAVNQDPLLVLRSQISDKALMKELGERDKIVAEMIDLQDPLVFSLYAGWLVSADYKKSEASFDGQIWFGKDVDAVTAGVGLTPCAFGFECGKKDLLVAIACLQESICENNRFDLAKAYSEKEGYNFGTVIDAYNRSVAAIERKDVGAFAIRAAGG